MAIPRMEHRAEAQAGYRCEEEHHETSGAVPRDRRMRVDRLAEGEDQEESEEDGAP